ncbi:hypothetical protein [Parasitella parasitica]|uniref:DUF4097 domain-containing protein n=1 Tax=Parasitella parasitica TaxID=35722 RepID=A0A0B7NT94_9FUNG|nr:hypothetical protein [Parasitella parasitica]
MSSRADEYSSPSSSSLQRDQNNINNSNRVEPRFFGHPSIYQNATTQKKDTTASLPTENPYWSNPPPPYSPPPNEPESSGCSVSMDPSAPPLEPSFTPHIQHSTPQTQAPTSQSSATSNYPPLSYQNQQQQTENYPPQGYSQYGAVNQRQHPFVNPNITTSDANLPVVSNWPWIAPPNGGGYPLPLPQQPQQSQPQSYCNPAKKQKNCFETFLKYVFYFFCICLVIRLIGLLSGGVSYADSCSHGFIWRSLPEQFEFSNNGLRIRVIGGNLSGGRITLKKMSKADSWDSASTGLVKSTALVSPASLADNLDLNYSLTHIDNGSTTLDIYIPHDLSSRACVSLNAVVYLPDTLKFISLDVQNTHIDSNEQAVNIETLSLWTTNSAIELGPRWVGKVMELKTTNAHIEINQAIENADAVILATTNGGIRFRQPIRGITDVIAAKTTNSGIDADTLLEAPAVQLMTTNGHVNVEDIRADRAELKTTNGRIGLSHANISQVVNAQTTNGALALHVNAGNRAEVIARTTNSQVSLSMPADHEGRFEIETSRTNKIEFVDPLGWSQLIYNKGYLAGARYNPASDKKPNTGHLQIKTSNANVHVHYANSDN